MVDESLKTCYTQKVVFFPKGGTTVQMGAKKQGNGGNGRKSILRGETPAVRHLLDQLARNSWAEFTINEEEGLTFENVRWVLERKFGSGRGRRFEIHRNRCTVYLNPSDHPLVRRRS